MNGDVDRVRRALSSVVFHGECERVKAKRQRHRNLGTLDNTSTLGKVPSPCESQRTGVPALGSDSRQDNGCGNRAAAFQQLVGPGVCHQGNSDGIGCVPPSS